MSLYPSLEDMTVAKMAQTQVQHQQAAQQAAVTASAVRAAEQAIAQTPATPGTTTTAVVYSSLYPSLDEYMGLSLTPEFVAQNMPLVAQNPPPQQAIVARGAGTSNVIAPVSGQNNLGMRRSDIKQGVQEMVLCKDSKGKVGVRVRAISKGLFVSFVNNNSPAALAGLRFGDQILQMNEETVAGWDTDKAMSFLKKCKPERISLIIRERPFERTITVQKDSTGHVGFVFKNGKITKIAKDTSAARNGLLIDHNLVEVNGQNVIGLKDSAICDIIAAGDRTTTLTVVPTFIFEHMMKHMSKDLVKKDMDHSIPEV